MIRREEEDTKRDKTGRAKKKNKKYEKKNKRQIITLNHEKGGRSKP